MEPLLSVLSGKIEAAEVENTADAGGFALAAAIQSGFPEVWLKRLDSYVFLSLAGCCGKPLCVIRFVCGKQPSYDVDGWNALVQNTGSPIVYLRNENWQIEEFITGEHKGLEDDVAVNIALERLAIIQSSSTDGLGLGMGLPEPRASMTRLCGILMGGLEKTSKDYFNTEYISAHVSDFLPEKEKDVVLAHRDYGMRNILFSALEFAGCRVIDWEAVLCSRYLDLAMFLIHIFNLDKCRFWQKVVGFSNSVDWPDYSEASLRGYLLLASLLHAESALVNGSPVQLTTLLQGIDDLLHHWSGVT